MLARLLHAVRTFAGFWIAFSGAALIGAALPVVAGTGGDGLIAVMFVPVGAWLMWLARRWIGWWAWGVAAVLIGYIGMGTGVRGVAYQGLDAGSAGHFAGWLTAVVAIPLAYLAARGMLRRRAVVAAERASH